MKTKTFLFLIFMQSIMCAFSQNGDQEGGGSYVKRIEHNRFAWGPYNIDSKMIDEKRLLDKFNAPVEFYFSPLYEVPESPAVFRIFRDSTVNVYILDYKTYKNANATDVNDEILSCSFTVSDQFAEKMYKKMVSLIDNIKARGPQYMIIHGYSVTFRTVVEDEVWSLKIHIPKGNALKMFDLCRQILDDANDNKLDEASYIKILDSFDFERQRPNN